ncbi:VanZ family protein [Candidatus Nomurabacteria bacterium]|nr:VanZ family protein [Candidatus Nomurabacteria bacterium]
MLTANQRRLLFLLAAAIWGGFIFYLSSVPNLASGLETWQDLILRKLAHVTVFAILTYLVARSLNSTQRHYLLFVVLAIIFYAFTDEFHQMSVIGRSGQATDILIDSLGVFLGVFLFIKQRKNLFD